MKKFLVVVSVAVVAVVAVGVIVGGCGGNDNPSKPNENGGNGSHTHTWGEWTETTPATCDMQGTEIRVCTQDGSHTETRATPRLSGPACEAGCSVDDVVYGTLTDSRDGETYRTVTICGKTWMAENLNYVVDSSWCYDDEPSNCEKYGRLYNWDAALSVCPTGWHLPDTAEWTYLIAATGGDDAGTKLKSKTPDWNGTDDYGFSALPGGFRANWEWNLNIGDSGYWWTNTEDEDDYFALLWSLHSVNDNALDVILAKSNGFSVRCVQ